MSGGGGFCFAPGAAACGKWILSWAGSPMQHLPTMSESELDAFERLLDAPDPQALAWITGEEPTPAEFDTPLLARLRGA